MTQLRQQLQIRQQQKSQQIVPQQSSYTPPPTHTHKPPTHIHKPIQQQQQKIHIQQKPQTQSPHTPLPPKPPTHIQQQKPPQQHNIQPNQQQHTPSPRTPTLHHTPTPQKPFQHTPSSHSPTHTQKQIQQHHQLHVQQPPQPTPLPHHRQVTTQPQKQQQLQTPPKVQQGDEPLATYPNGKGGQTIYAGDLQCLEQGQWLNDTVINVLLHWVQKEVWAGRLVNQTRICNSFWFTRVSRNTTTGNTTAIGDNLIQMRRWYPGGHPFTVPIVGIPICLQHHWVAVMVIQRESEVWLWGMDSLRSTVLENVREVVTSTVQMCCPGKKIVWTDILVQRQNNGSDCGIHAIKNITRTGQYMATEAYPNARSLESWLRDSPNLTRQEMRAAFRGIMQGRTHAHPPFLLNSVEELMAELNISLEEEDEDMGFIILPTTEVSLGTDFCVLNLTQDIVRINEHLEQQLLMWASSARKGLQNEGRRRLIFLRTWQGFSVRLTARSSGFVKAVMKRIG